MSYSSLAVSVDYETMGGCACALCCAAPQPVEQTASAEPQSFDTNTADADQNVDALLAGYKWAQTSLTYSFPDSGLDYSYSFYEEATNGFRQFNAAQQAAAREAFEMYASFSGLTFTELTGAADRDADIAMAVSSVPSTAWAYYPSSGDWGGDAWFNPNSYNNPAMGNYAWSTVMHEIGHGLGLKHGHETGGPGALNAAQDSHEYSIMTYRSYEGSPGNAYTNGAWSGPQTPMMFDIAAIQRLYGANYAHENGDTVYSFTSTSGRMFVDGEGRTAPGDNVIFRTIWDGGGVDTYNFNAHSTDLAIDLTPGGYSDLDVGGYAQRAYLGGGVGADGHVYNALLHNGDVRSLIENAIAGSGDDLLTGNFGDNRLEGRDGDDTLLGGAGEDALLGGRGADVFLFDAADFAAGERDVIFDSAFVDGDALTLSGFGVGFFDASLGAAGLGVLAAGDGLLIDSLGDVAALGGLSGFGLSESATGSALIEVEVSGGLAEIEIASADWDALEPLIPAQPDVLIGEIGVATVHQTTRDAWTRVDFTASIQDAIVVLGPPSIQGGDPSVVRIREVDATGFWFRLEEFAYLDGAHTVETVSWMAVAEGTHELADGRVIAAGDALVGSAGSRIDIGDGFDDAPIVLSQVASVNAADPVFARHWNVDETGFSARLFEEEALDGAHSPETTNWIALEAGGGEVTAALAPTLIDPTVDLIAFDQPFAAAPAVLADMQSLNGGDPATLRLVETSPGAAKLVLQEETSLDAEIGHVGESVGYVAAEARQLFGVSVAEAPDAGAVIGEAGAVDIAQGAREEWTYVAFDRPIDDAVVVMGPVSVNGGDPAIAEVRNVTRDGFEARIGEFAYLDGVHGVETIGWLAVSAGDHLLANGARISAGTGEAAAGASDFAFSGAFDAAPLVFGQVASQRDGDPAVSRVFDVDADGFRAVIEEEEAADGPAVAEAFNWIAMEPSAAALSGGPFAAAALADGVAPAFREVGVDPADYDQLVFLASTQSFNGGDTYALRYQAREDDLRLMLQEEKSADEEYGHVAEDAAFLAMESGTIFGDPLLA